ncbi:hypothetical protein CASFOL_037266 [Castilleja foliolosa]|uniref:Protein N-terminal glutamine amidohydrolase alpha beta roll domain-containing protein n=1 Tax=Castilleja foliolosa TaxID=1961234 RepID=A0ABD3BP97_9LAMI
MIPLSHQKASHRADGIILWYYHVICVQKRKESNLSNMGLFEAEMSSDAFQLRGMSEIRLLPSLFAARIKIRDNPHSAFCAFGVILLSWMSFQEILEFLNFLLRHQNAFRICSFHQF